jgi:hypothetical protein
VSIRASNTIVVINFRIMGLPSWAPSHDHGERGLDHKMRQASRFVQILHCGGLLLLVTPVDGKAPGLLRCLECDRIDPSAVTTK